MALVNYEPWSLLDRFQQQLNQLGYPDKLIAGNDNNSSNVVTSHWCPAVDIKEESSRFLITADLLTRCRSKGY